MALDPITLLAIATAALAAAGILMIRASRTPGADDVVRGTGAAFLVEAAGLAAILAAPNAMISPVRVLGNAVLMLGSGLVWSAMRRAMRGVAPRPTLVAAGALGWLGLVALAAPTLGWRVGLGSGVIAAYGFAAAFELLRGRSWLRDARGFGALVLAAHAGFYLVRAVLGPAVGFGTWGPSLAQGWGGMLGVETMLFALSLGAAVLAMSRAPVARPTPRPDALDDDLTGVGNRVALYAAGAGLLAAAAAAGRPFAALAMDIDGLAALNARHGRDAGDRLLVAFARLAHDYLPPTSLVCSLGGGAFAALLPDADPLRARAIAAELCSLFAHLTLDGPAGPVVATVSVGVAQGGRAQPALVEILAEAERGLDGAKARGPGHVVHADDLSAAAVSTAA